MMVNSVMNESGILASGSSKHAWLLNVGILVAWGNKINFSLCVTKQYTYVWLVFSELVTNNYLAVKVCSYTGSKHS